MTDTLDRATSLTATGVPGRSLSPGPRAPEQFDAIVIGGGQAGLAAGYHLKKRGLSFVILDAEKRTGDTWRKRWDSLRLFTPARNDGLDGMRFPAPADYFPTKDEMADYLEDYAREFALPIRHGVRVERLTKESGRFIVEAGGQRFIAGEVIVAMSAYRQPEVPTFAGSLDAGIVQFHSADYRNSCQLTPGPVLLVGAGNSAAEIARELAPTHRVILAGTYPGHVPFSMETYLGRNVLGRVLLGGVFHHLLTLKTPIGRRMRQKVEGHTSPLIRTRPNDLAVAGVERVGRISGISDGRPVTAEGKALDVANVIWCTGYRPGFEWIELPVFGEDGRPLHHRGISNTDGLYFLGFGFIYAFSSMMIQGVSRDAAYLARYIAARVAMPHIA